MSDQGYFPRGTVLRRVHEQRSVGLLYGQRALLIGALHPVNFTGTFLSSRSLDEPWQRLARTGKAFETIFFGTKAEADEVLERVARLHTRVNGEMPEAAGPWEAGTAYDAFDPELMLWTVAVIMDSTEVIHDHLVRRLGDDEREELWQGYIRFAELFGMPRSAAPGSYGEFREWWRWMFAERLHLTPEARQVGKQVAFAIPVPRYLRPTRGPHNLVLLGTLTPEERGLYGFGWNGAQEAAFRAFSAWSRRTRGLLPASVRVGYNTDSFELVARTERRMIERSGATPMAYLSRGAGSR
jgi:uncharacterized protein (DUF2236 family)